MYKIKRSRADQFTPSTPVGSNCTLISPGHPMLSFSGPLPRLPARVQMYINVSFSCCYGYLCTSVAYLSTSACISQLTFARFLYFTTFPSGEGGGGATPPPWRLETKRRIA